MKRTTKIIIGIVLFTVCATSVPVVTGYLVDRINQNRTTQIMDGDTFTIKAEGPVNVGVVTTKGNGPTKILSASGETIGVTEEGVMAHYWDLKIKLSPGTYKASGEAASLIIGSGQVVNPNDDARNSASTRKMTIFMFFVGLVTGSVSVPVLVRDPNSTDGSNAEADGYAN